MGASEDTRSQGFLSDKNSRSQDSMPGRSFALGPHLENSSASQNGTNGNGKEDNGDDQEEDFCSDEDDEDSGEERGRLKLDNWWRKEKKKIGLESLEITYTVKSSPSEEDDKVVMEVTLGDLTAEGDGENIDTARDQAAMFMLDQLKNILDEEGEEGLRRAIDEEGDEEEEVGLTSANRNVVDEAVIGDTDDEGAGSPIQQKTAVHQNQLSQAIAAPPQVKAMPAKFGPQGEQAVPGEEYGLSIKNVRDPNDEKVVDVYNLPRRTKMSLLSLLARTEQDGELSDDEEAEASRFLGLFQEVLALRASHRLGDHHVRSLQQMVARAGLAPQPQPQQPAFYQPAPPPRPAPPPKPDSSDRASESDTMGSLDVEGTISRWSKGRSTSSESESDEQASGAEGSDVEDINDAGVAEEGDVASLSVLKENENVEGNVSRNYKERGAAEVGSEQYKIGDEAENSDVENAEPEDKVEKEGDSGIHEKGSTLEGSSSEEGEDEEDYCPGGYHPINSGDFLNERLNEEYSQSFTNMPLQDSILII